jgi:hypothetical protein
MKTETFAELVDSMNEVLDHTRGRRSLLRTTTLLRPPAPAAFGRRVRQSIVARAITPDCGAGPKANVPSPESRRSRRT